MPRKRGGDANSLRRVSAQVEGERSFGRKSRKSAANSNGKGKEKREEHVKEMHANAMHCIYCRSNLWEEKLKSSLFGLELKQYRGG